MGARDPMLCPIDPRLQGHAVVSSLVQSREDCPECVLSMDGSPSYCSANVSVRGFSGSCFNHIFCVVVVVVWIRLCRLYAHASSRRLFASPWTRIDDVCDLSMLI